MNTFFNHLQPTIIQATMNEELPEKVRGRFFINFNVFGIKYFDEHYILQENEYGVPYLILRENHNDNAPDMTGAIMLENSMDYDVLDLPRIYIDITDKFVNDEDGTFQHFVSQAIADNKIWPYGIDNFMAGEDYYTNYTLYNYLALADEIEVPNFGVRLPNYLDAFGFINTKYWKDLSGEMYKDYNNIQYFNEKNNIIDNKFSTEELNNFYSTFTGLILKYTKIPTDKLYEQKNQIYNLVLNYYNNFKSDCGSNALSLILNSGYTTQTNVNIKCGCNTNTSDTDEKITASCYDLYQAAMKNWLKTMLSDKEFYEDWFMIYLNETDYIPNDVLIEMIQSLFEEFLNEQHILSFVKSGRKINCECPTISFDENECNYNILKNYLKIMEWIFDDKLDANVNKIKIYGGQFAELLPYLQF